MCLKLLKAGHVVASQKFKQYFLTAAREIHLLSEQQRLDPKKLELLKSQMDQIIASKKDKKPEGEQDDIVHYFHRIEKRFKKMKRKHEEQLEEIFKEFTTHRAEEYSPQAAHTTFMEKSIK